MSEKIQNSIYFLKDEVRIRNKRTRQVLIKTIDFDFLNKLFKGKDFTEQQVKQNLSNDYEIKVYYKKAKNNVKWKEFIETVVEEGEDILTSNRSKSESYIILIKNIKTNRIYASTGGYAHITVQELATTDFGIEILSRIVKSDDKALKSTKERNLTGGIQGEIKFFRNDYNLYENDNFGKIYNELSASINKKTLMEIFGFQDKDLKGDSLCIVKNSFSLKKSISFKELLEIIKKCELLLLKPPVVEINNVEKLTRSENILIENLRDDVLLKIYSNYTNEEDFYSVEISNKDFEKYFSANYYEINLSFKREVNIIRVDDTIRNIQDILDSIKIKIGKDLNYIDFKKVIENASIETFDENEAILTKDSLIDHFCTEINYSENVYFLIEKDWYRVKKTFIDNINEQASFFLKDNKFDGPKLNKWNIGSENKYNASHLGQDNTFVFDKITPLYIETCDLLKVNKDKVYFFHVKKGFDNSMRDLCNQVLISAKKVQEDLRLNYTYLTLLYNDASKYKGDKDYYKSIKKQFDKISQSDFIDLIKDKTFVFVLAVLDTAKTKRDLYENIERFDSNIAKFTLIDLSKDMRALGMEFKVLQIEK